jgi:hypothetical protein
MQSLHNMLVSRKSVREVVLPPTNARDRWHWPDIINHLLSTFLSSVNFCEFAVNLRESLIPIFSKETRGRWAAVVLRSLGSRLAKPSFFACL